jgi:beta-lactamase class A
MRAAVTAAVLALGAVFVAGCADPDVPAAAGARAGTSGSAQSTDPQTAPASPSGYGTTGGPAGTAAADAGPARRPELLRYLSTVPGTVGLVVRDTVTGSTSQAGDPAHATWTASTIKLAVATALLERNRAGTIRLTGADRANLRSMLVDSSNDATDALWQKYDGVAMIPAFQQRYGMATLAVVSGYRPYWRHLQCSAADLAAVMAFALANLAAADRADLVGWLRAAARVQPWGVPAAGTGAAPGHKPGWAFKPENRPDHWVVHSVGFAGAGERYVVAVTYDLPKGRTAKQGAQVVSDVAALAFAQPKRPVAGP